MPGRSEELRSWGVTLTASAPELINSRAMTYQPDVKRSPCNCLQLGIVNFIEIDKRLPGATNGP